ncbi:MAG: peptide deformylase [Acetanaerobacterium sp.]
MATRKIVLIGDEILHKTSREVTVFDSKLATLLDDMMETMHKNDGAGLAAPQVGVLKRAVVIDVGDDTLYELINPVIVKTAGVQEGAEGCLSVPGEFGVVERPNEVTVEAYDRHGKKITVSGTEILARAFCHEIDHLNGRLFTDIATRMLSDEELEKKDKKKR